VYYLKGDGGKGEEHRARSVESLQTVIITSSAWIGEPKEHPSHEIQEKGVEIMEWEKKESERWGKGVSSEGQKCSKLDVKPPFGR